MKLGSETGSLKRRLAEAEENLRLIRERKSEFVRETDIPLQLIKDERRMEQEIEKLQVWLVQKEVILSPEPSGLRPPTLFPGLVPFGVDNADVFFGRDRETKVLVAHIERDMVVVVNGLSGCGKSSLMRAGVIPSLHELGYHIVYTPVFENLIEDMLREIGRALGTREVPHDYVDALQELHREQSGQDIVLIVDQFEQALRPSHDPHALEEFFRGIPRLITGVRPFAKVVIVLRADWLIFLEASVRQFYPRLNVHSCIVTLHPLNREAAIEAIVKPLQKRQVPYDEEVVEEIVDHLQTSSVGPSYGPYIQPIQLQIVLRALFNLAEEGGASQQALSKQVYNQSGGVESILRGHLTTSLGHEPDAWRLLARFIAQDGQTGRMIRRSELLAVPAAEDVAVQLRFLVDQGFVEAYEADDVGETFYRLSHDYLVEEIVDYLNENLDKQGWKLAEDWLASGTVEWHGSIQRGGRDGLMLERNRYLQVYEHRDRLRLTDDSRRLLVLSSLRYGHEGLGYWLSRGSDSEADVEDVADKLLLAQPEVQRTARNALDGSVRPSQETVTVLGEKGRQSLRKRLWQAAECPDDQARRDAAARALWVLQAFDTREERLQVGAIVFRRWMRDHSLQIASYVLIALFALMLVVVPLYVREKLRGSWELIRSLKAGATPLVVVDPSDLETIYAVTLGTSGTRKGCSLFVQRTGGDWELLSSDLGKVWPTAMAVVHDESALSFYLSLYGGGVLKSEDGGHTWELVNRGLPSRALTSLVADPYDAQTLYLGTDDWRGVLRSLDGGDSWDFYDYTQEIYGATISRLAFTRANGGALIAGTWDGRILIHRRGALDWELRSSIARGGISALVVAGADDRFIYAGTSKGVVLRSRDGGDNWTVLGQPSSQGQLLFNITAMAVAPDDPERLYVSVYGNGGYTVWESQDMGDTWEAVGGIGLPRVPIQSLVMTGREPYRLVAGTADGLFTSIGGGGNWEKEPLTDPLADVRTVAVGARNIAPVYVVVGGSIYTNEGSIYEDPGNDQHEWMFGKGLRAEEVRTVVVDPDNPDVAYAGVLLLGEWSVFITRNGGHTWEQTTSPPIEPIPPDTTALAVAKTPNGRTVLYAGTFGCSVFRSMDEGNSWETFGRSRCDQVVENMPVDVRQLAIDVGDPSVVYAAAAQWFFRSLDGGWTWQSSHLGTSSPIVAMVADPVKPHTVYVITRFDGFLRSEDGGQTWQRMNSRYFEGAEPSALAVGSAQTGHVIVGASNGEVWETLDGGRTWRSIRENLAISFITTIATSEAMADRILVGSKSDGIALFTPGRLFGSTR